MEPERFQSGVSKLISVRQQGKKQVECDLQCTHKKTDTEVTEVTWNLTEKNYRKQK